MLSCGNINVTRSNKHLADMNDGTAQPLRVVGIGASAGGLSALERFFRALPEETGDAYVVVQHLSPNFKSVMCELLTGFSKMPAVLAEDRMRLTPNRIFLIPPGKNLELEDDCLRVSVRSDARSLHLSIDRFFSSLAQNFGVHSVGVILSGNGSDGSRGIQDIFRAGGTVMVQSPETAAFDGMPRAALKSHIASIIGSPDSIARALSPKHVSTDPGAFAAQGLQPPIDAGGEMTAIFERLIERFGLDFSEYRSATVERRIAKRMQLHHFSSIAEYTRFLQNDHTELDELWFELLIGVTSFFRDAEAFALLESELLPALVEEHQTQSDVIRVWVAGCATGEEAYSIAILLDEACRKISPSQNFRIFATDVHLRALEQASQGIFSAESLETMSAARLEGYFTEVDEGFQVKPRLRRCLVFSEHNVLRDPPFTRIDLVSCRNLLIYLTPKAQNRVLKLFDFSLRPHGILFLGSSEALGEETPSIQPVNQSWRLFRKTELPNTAPQALPSSPRRHYPIKRIPSSYLPRRAKPQVFTERVLSQVLERYVPAGFLIDKHRNLLHVFGDCERFLQVHGQVSLDLVTLLKTPLRLPVTTVIHQTLSMRESSQISATLDSGEVVTLVVDPIKPSDDPLELLFVGVKLRQPTTTLPSKEIIALSDVAAQRILELEHELDDAHTHLQAVVEDSETSNEELQAINEELQSTSEEFYTINAEYERKNSELVELTNDLTMLMNCTSIGLVFLDPDLVVRRFTPLITPIFRLREQDIGRPLIEIADRLGTEHHLEVLQRCHTVMATGQVIETEVTGPNQRAMLERIHPYRSNQQITGVILSYIDLSIVKESEEALLKSQSLSEAIFESFAANIAVIDAHGTITAVNQRWQDFALENSGEDLDLSTLSVGINYLDVCIHAVTHDSTSEAARAAVGIREVLSGKRELFELLYPCHSSTEKRWFLMRVGRIKEPHGGALVAHINVSELEHLRREAIDSGIHITNLAEAVNASADAIVVFDLKTVHHANPAFLELAELTAVVNTEHVISLFPAREREALILAMRQRNPWFGEVELTSQSSGRKRIVAVQMSSINGDDSFVAVLRDITDERNLQQKAGQAQRLESVGTLAGGIAHDFNNIIAAILGYAELIRKHVEGNPQASQDLEQIVTATQRAKTLVQQIRTFSRQEDAPATVRLLTNRIIEETLQLLKGVIPSSTRIEAVLAPQPIWIEADQGELQRILMNIVTNAWHALEGRSGLIHIEVDAFEESPGETWWRARVSDDGKGMSPEVIEHAFDPFFTTKELGTGMGLSIVHGIVKRMNGHIHIDSEVGQGTTVTVCLPTTSPGRYNLPRASPTTPLQTPTSKAGSIFVLDDEPQILLLVTRLLKEKGYDVMSFATGEALLLAVEELGTPDLILSDKDMPHMTGVELFLDLRSRGITCPFILMGGYITDDARQHAFDAIIDKPFEHQELEDLVETLLHPSEIKAPSPQESDDRVPPGEHLSFHSRHLQQWHIDCSQSVPVVQRYVLME